MAKFRRRKFIVNNPVQFSYAGISIWVVLIGLILLGTVIYYTIMTVTLDKFSAAGNVEAYRMVKEVDLLIIKRLFLLIPLFIVGGGLLLVMYLHRIAGPLFRIEKTLNEMAEGKKVNPVKLREKDFFKSLAEALNKVISNR